jgi:hypothetical protein
MGFKNSPLEQKPEDKKKPFAMEERPEKPRSSRAEHTSIEFTPDSAKVEDFEGNITENKPETPETAYRQLTETEIIIVNKEVERHITSNPKEIRGASPAEVTAYEDKYREKIAQEILAERIESQDLKKAA